MSIRYAALLAIAIVLTAICGSTEAQSFGRTGGTGGGGGLGSSSGFGGGGFGAGGGGAGGGGLGGATGAGPGFAAAQERFLVDESASQGFVGRDSEDTRQFFSALGNAQQSFMEDLGLQPNNNRGNSRGRQQAPPVRITLRVAFARPIVNPMTTSDAIAERFAESLSNRVIAPQVRVSGRKVTLSGRVATEYEKLVAEKMALLEPGVSQVENRLVVTIP